jgi:hypothetical protein
LLAKFRRHLTYANVVSTLCLFVLLGGSAYAAKAITGRQIKDSSLTTKDVKDRSLLSRDFRSGQLPRGLQGQQGPQGQAGQNGTTGQTGPRGPSKTFARAFNPTGTLFFDTTEGTLSTLTLPAGSYAFTAMAAVSGPITCRIRNQGTVIAEGTTSSSSDTMTLSGVATNSGGTATFTCQIPSGSGGAGNTTFRAVQVETLTMQTG